MNKLGAAASLSLLVACQGTTPAPDLPGPVPPRPHAPVRAVATQPPAFVDLPCEGEEDWLACTTRRAEARSAACDAGEAKACFALTKQVFQSKVPVWLPGSVRAVSRACELSPNVPEACLLAANHAESAEHKRALLDRGCATGEARACERLGGLFASAEGDGKLDAAFDAYRRACDLGSCTLLGDAHVTFSIPRAKVETGFALLKERCAKDDHEACARGAKLWRTASSRHNADFAQAHELYAMPCAKGQRSFCLQQAELAAVGGPGLAPDAKVARAALDRVCPLPVDPGWSSSLCLGAARIHAKGAGSLAADPDAAKALLRGLCEANKERGCLRLGWLSAGRGGVDPLVKPSKKGMSRAESAAACELGSVADCVFTGFLIEPQAEKARELYQRACTRTRAPELCVAASAMPAPKS